MSRWAGRASNERAPSPQAMVEGDGDSVRICGRGNGGPPEPPGGWPPDDEVDVCCWGFMEDSWAGCTCWIPVFNYPDGQAPPAEQKRQWLAAGIAPNTRDGMCPDCAYRPDSPEKTGDATYAGDPEFLERIAREGERFWCHQGMLLVVAWRHPSGVEVPGHAGAYCPPVVDGVPYQADGSPGLLCAGWTARSRALAGGGRA